MKRGVALAWIGVLLAMVGLCGCSARLGPEAELAVAAAADERTAAVSDDDCEVVLRYSRRGGFAAVDETWTLYGDGTLEADGSSVRQIPGAVMESLLQEAEASGFFAYRAGLSKGAVCADCFTYSLTICAGDKQNTVVVRGLDERAPRAILDLFERVHELVRAG